MAQDWTDAAQDQLARGRAILRQQSDNHRDLTKTLFLIDSASMAATIVQDLAILTVKAGTQGGALTARQAMRWCADNRLQVARDLAPTVVSPSKMQ